MALRARVLAAGLMIGALWTEPALAQVDDPRATDAVAFFGAMCGQAVAAWTFPTDHAKYQFAWLSQKDAARFGEPAG